MGGPGLASPEGRMRLLEALRREGLEARMHAYEYIVWDEEGFCAIVMVEPSAGRVDVLELSPRSSARVLRAILSVDPEVEVRFLRPTA
mgnify:CR=1 FL=1